MDRSDPLTVEDLVRRGLPEAEALDLLRRVEEAAGVADATDRWSFVSRQLLGAASSGRGARGPLPGGLPVVGRTAGAAPGLVAAGRHPIPVQPRPPPGRAGPPVRGRSARLVGPGPCRLLGRARPRPGHPLRAAVRGRGGPGRRAGTSALVPGGLAEHRRQLLPGRARGGRLAPALGGRGPSRDHLSRARAAVQPGGRRPGRGGPGPRRLGGAAAPPDDRGRGRPARRHPGRLRGGLRGGELRAPRGRTPARRSAGLAWSSPRMRSIGAARDCRSTPSSNRLAGTGPSSSRRPTRRRPRSGPATSPGTTSSRPATTSRRSPATPRRGRSSSSPRGRRAIPRRSPGTRRRRSRPPPTASSTRTSSRATCSPGRRAWAG